MEPLTGENSISSRLKAVLSAAVILLLGPGCDSVRSAFPGGQSKAGPLAVVLETPSVTIGSATPITARAGSVDISREASWSVSEELARVECSSVGCAVVGVKDGWATITAEWQEQHASTKAQVVTIVALRIVPDFVRIELGPPVKGDARRKQTAIQGSLTLKALGMRSDGTESDVTSAVKWTSTNPLHVEVNSGKLTAKETDVSEEIRVAVNGQYAQATVSVAPPPQPPAQKPFVTQWELDHSSVPLGTTTLDLGPPRKVELPPSLAPKLSPAPSPPADPLDLPCPMGYRRIGPGYCSK